MLSVKIDEEYGIAVLEPSGPLTADDFKLAATIIDLYIEKTGRLRGLIIHAEHFPGWDSFAALIAHLRFVKDHHKQIARVAFSTDSALGDFAEKIGSHFVNAEIKVFAFNAYDCASEWLLNNTTGQT